MWCQESFFGDGPFGLVTVIARADAAERVVVFYSPDEPVRVRIKDGLEDLGFSGTATASLLPIEPDDDTRRLFEAEGKDECRIVKV